MKSTRLSLLSFSRSDFVGIFEVEEEFLVVKYIAVAFQPGLETHGYVLLDVLSPNPDGYFLIWFPDEMGDDLGARLGHDSIDGDNCVSWFESTALGGKEWF